MTTIKPTFLLEKQKDEQIIDNVLSGSSEVAFRVVRTVPKSPSSLVPDEMGMITNFASNVRQRYDGEISESDLSRIYRKLKFHLDYGFTYDRIYGDYPIWDDISKRIDAPPDLLKVVDRLFLEWIIAYNWQLKTEQAKNFIHEVLDLFTGPMQSRGDIYVALQNIDTVLTHVQKNLRGKRLFYQHTSHGLLTKNPPHSSPSDNSDKKTVQKRPITPPKRKVSPYVDSYQRTQILKRLKTYEITPQLVVSVLEHPELIPIAMELCAGIEEAEIFVSSVNQLSRTQNTYATILEALDHLGTVNRYFLHVDKYKCVHPLDQGGYLLSPENVVWVISNPELFQIAEKLATNSFGDVSELSRGIKRIHDFDKNYYDPIEVAENLIVRVRRECCGIELPLRELEKKILVVLEDRKLRFSRPDSYWIAYEISSSEKTNPEIVAQYQIARLMGMDDASIRQATIEIFGHKMAEESLNEKYSEDPSYYYRMLLLYADNYAEEFLADVRELYGRSVSNQRILNILDAATTVDINNKNELLRYTVERLQQEDNLPFVDLELRHFEGVNIDLSPEKIEALKNYYRECWQEIVGEDRRYQVPSNGRAVVMGSDLLSELLQLKSIRFIQEEIDAPGILMKFEFAFENHSFTKNFIVEKDGTIRGFHQASASEEFKAVIEAVALSYYRDLVLPGSIYFYEPNTDLPRQSRPRKMNTPRELSRPQAKPIRPDSAKINPISQYDFQLWHETQERIRHYVTGFRRWVREGFLASPEKQEQARKAGVQLPIGYTWVDEFMRGSKTADGVSQHFDKNGDLLKETVFSPPKRATKELYELLLQKEV